MSLHLKDCTLCTLSREQHNIRCDCVAADTQVRMADGSENKICDIRIGDRVMTQRGVVEVADIYRGEELKMVSLTTENGLNLVATGTHPILTACGMVRAVDLNLKSMIKTEEGDSEIIELKRVNYEAMVYSLSLEDKEIISCNGIYTGDFTWQNSL